MPSTAPAIPPLPGSSNTLPETPVKECASIQLPISGTCNCRHASKPVRSTQYSGKPFVPCGANPFESVMRRRPAGARPASRPTHRGWERRGRGARARAATSVRDAGRRDGSSTCAARRARRRRCRARCRRRRAARAAALRRGVRTRRDRSRDRASARRVRWRRAGRRSGRCRPMRARSALPLVTAATGTRAAMRSSAAIGVGIALHAIALGEEGFECGADMRHVVARQFHRARQRELAQRAEVVGQVRMLGVDDVAQAAHLVDGEAFGGARAMRAAASRAARGPRARRWARTARACRRGRG